MSGDLLPMYGSGREIRGGLRFALHRDGGRRTTLKLEVELTHTPAPSLFARGSHLKPP